MTLSRNRSFPSRRPLLLAALSGVLLAGTFLPTAGAAVQDATAEQIIARAGGQVFTRGPFETWLFERHGVPHAQEFVFEALLLDEARRRGLLPDGEAIESALQQEEQMIIASAHRSDPERYFKRLADTGFTPESWRERRRAEWQVELAMRAICRADRNLDEEQLREVFRQEYGPDAELVRLEVLFFNAYYHEPNPDPEADPEAPLEFDVEARKVEAHQRATQARTELLAGRAFEELRAESDVPASRFVSRGVIAHWKRSLLGREFDAPVDSLDLPGEVAPVITTWDGAWVVRLLERRQVDFDSVRAELEQRALNSDVTGEELSNLRLRLIADAEMVLR